MYTLEEIAALRHRCLELRLEGADLLELYTDEQLRTICNGIGPAFFPAELRRAVDKLHPTLKADAALHDVEFERSDGTWSSFSAANDRFLRNGLRLANAAYGWYDPRRYIVRADARRFYAILTATGWIAWQQAFEARKAKKA